MAAPRLLLLMSDTGGGHRAAAAAIAAQALRLRPDAQVEVVDAIAAVSTFWRGVAGLYGPITRRTPWLWGALFSAFGGASGAPLWQALNGAAVLSVRHRFLTLVDAWRPDAVVSTHPLINQGCQAARVLYAQERGRTIPFGVVVTDPVTFHAAWIEPKADRTFVATHEARARAVSCGAPLERVTVAGLPIHPEFFDGSMAPDAARTGLGLPRDTPVGLVTAGGAGRGTLRALVEALLNIGPRPHILAVAGRDVAAETRLRARANQVEGGRLHVFGFTNSMPVLMAASDVVVTKAGPGTLFEALALGKPVVVMDALPGQEAGNVTLVRDHGLGAVALEGPAQAASAVEALLADPAAREKAAQAGRALSQPHAAREIAQWMLSMAQGAG